MSSTILSPKGLVRPSSLFANVFIADEINNSSDSILALTSLNVFSISSGFNLAMSTSMVILYFFSARDINFFRASI